MVDNNHFPFYQTIQNGEFLPENIRTLIQENTLKRSNKSQNFIQNTWSKYNGVKWPGDEKPSRLRFVDSKISDGILEIILDPCVSYKDFIGTRSPDFNRTFSKDYLPNPLSVDALVLTSDNKIIITVRSQSTDHKPGGLHASFGGWITIQEDMSDNSVDIVKAIKREVCEESGISIDEISNPTCKGVINAYDKVEPAAIFKLSTSLTSKEILDRNNDGENMLMFVNIDCDKIIEIVTTYPFAFCVSGLTLLISLIGEKFGEIKMKDCLDILDKRVGKDFNLDNFIIEENRDISKFQKSKKKWR